MDARVWDTDLAAGGRLMARLALFAGFSDEPRRLTRLFLSDAHRRAAHAFIGWCGETGLQVTKNAQLNEMFFAQSDNQAMADAGVPAHTLSVGYMFPDYHGADYEWQIWPSFAGPPSYDPTTGTLVQHASGLTPNGLSVGVSYRFLGQ